MGRNKKKSKAAQQASEEDEDNRNSAAGSGEDEVAEETNNAPAAAPASQAASDAGSEVGSGSDDEESKAAKAKKQKRIEEMMARKNNKKKGGKAREDEKAKEDKPGQSAKRKTAKEGDDGEDSSGDDDDSDIEVTRQEAVEVLYCPICTFPAEMCEFSGMMDKCRPWLQEHAAELADAEERGRKRRILTEKERLEAMIEGRGIKKALERIVVLEVEKRTGKRMITSVFGMDLFGFNLKDLSKDWRKTFACGAGVRAAEEGKHQDCIDIQGSVEDRLVEMLLDKYNVPKDSIYIIRNKKKEKYFS